MTKSEILAAIKALEASFTNFHHEFCKSLEEIDARIAILTNTASFPPLSLTSQPTPTSETPSITKPSVADDAFEVSEIELLRKLEPAMFVAALSTSDVGLVTPNETLPSSFLLSKTQVVALSDELEDKVFRISFPIAPFYSLPLLLGDTHHRLSISESDCPVYLSWNITASGDHSKKSASTPIPCCLTPAYLMCLKIICTEPLFRTFCGPAVTSWTEEPPGIDETSGNFFLDLNVAPLYRSETWIQGRPSCSLSLSLICGEKHICLAALHVKFHSSVSYNCIGFVYFLAQMCVIGECLVIEPYLCCISLNWIFYPFAWWCSGNMNAFCNVRNYVTPALLYRIYADGDSLMVEFTQLMNFGCLRGCNVHCDCIRAQCPDKFFHRISLLLSLLLEPSLVILLNLIESIEVSVEDLWPERTTELNVMVRVHGAAVTPSSFIKPGYVFIQVFPLSTDWVAEINYNAGGNFKFGFPMAFPTTMLSWSVFEFEGLRKEEFQHDRKAIKWANDSLLKTTALPDIIFCYQFQVPKTGSLKIDDFICGEVTWNLDTLRAFMVMRSNGQPLRFLLSNDSDQLTKLIGESWKGSLFCWQVEHHWVDGNIIRIQEFLLEDSNFFPYQIPISFFGVCVFVDNIESVEHNRVHSSFLEVSILFCVLGNMGLSEAWATTNNFTDLHSLGLLPLFGLIGVRIRDCLPNGHANVMVQVQVLTLCFFSDLLEQQAALNNVTLHNAKGLGLQDLRAKNQRDVSLQLPKMSPFQAMFGRLPPTIPMCTRGSSSTQAVEDVLTERDTLLKKENFSQVQERMRYQANKKRKDLELSAGNLVLIKLQPYQQITLSGRANHKLGKRYYGPFKILERVGVVAYRVDLPRDCKIHLVFHISVLRKFNGDQVTATLPKESLQNHPLTMPKAIISARHVLKQGHLIKQAFIQWECIPPKDATWEDYEDFIKEFPHLNLEDKVNFEGEWNDTPTVIQPWIQNHSRVNPYSKIQFNLI